MVYTRQRGSGVIAARFLSASASCRRLQHLPLPYALKVVAVKVKVFPQALYGAEISRPPWRVQPSAVSCLCLSVVPRKAFSISAGGSELG